MYGKGPLVSGRDRIIRRFIAALAAITVLLLAPNTAHADGPADEQRFLSATNELPMYVLPKGHDSTPADILAGGYAACAAMDQYPDDPMKAAYNYYKGGNTIDGEITNDGLLFLRDASIYLCSRHSTLFMPA